MYFIGQRDIRTLFSSGGHVLGSSPSTPSSNSASRAITIDLSPTEKLRNVWADRFKTNNEIKKPSESSESASQSKIKAKVTESTSAWQQIDDDVLMEVVENTVIEITDDNSNPIPSHTDAIPSHPDGVSVKKHVQDVLGDDDDIIDIIDDEFDDSLNENRDSPTDLTAIDAVFGTEEFMADFNNINGAIMNDPEYVGRPDKEIIKCPICNSGMERSELTIHIEEGCRGITVSINPRDKRIKPLPFHKKPKVSRVSSVEAERLRLAGYSQDTIDQLRAQETEYNERIMREMAEEKRQRRTAALSGESNVIIPKAEPETRRETVPQPPAEEMAECPICSLVFSVDQIWDHYSKDHENLG